MLVTQQEVLAATQLTAADVNVVLHRLVMTTPEHPVVCTEFRGMTYDGRFVYLCTHAGGDVQVHHLQYKRGALSNGFLLYAV